MGILDPGAFDEVTKTVTDAGRNLASWPRQILEMLGGRGSNPGNPGSSHDGIFKGSSHGSHGGSRNVNALRARIRAKGAREAEALMARPSGPDSQGFVPKTTFAREAEEKRRGNKIFGT